MPFGIFRHMIDSEGTEVEGYYTQYGEYGVRSEAYEFESEEEADETCHNENGWFHQEFPDDYNDFTVVELDD